jgi:hypothetical protein
MGMVEMDTKKVELWDDYFLGKGEGGDRILREMKKRFMRSRDVGDYHTGKEDI